MLWQSSGFSPTLQLNSYSACQELGCGNPSLQGWESCESPSVGVGELQTLSETALPSFKGKNP